MKSLNNQQVLDIAYPRIYKQGRKSVNKDNACVYKGPKGLRCAIGMCISRNDYRKEFDDAGDSSISTMITRDYFDKRFAHAEVDFLSRLQEVHDSMDLNSSTVTFRNEWERRVSKLADEWDLKLPSVV